MSILHRRLRFVLLLAVLVLYSACGPSSGAAPTVGAAAPAFTLPNLSGDAVDLPEQQGKVVIVNFWATWCAPCEKETPRLVQWYEAHRDDGLVILGVDALYLDNRESVERFAETYKVTYPILLDAEGMISKQWRAQQLPRSYVIDRAGVVRFTRIGEITDDDFQEHVQPLLDAG